MNLLRNIKKISVLAALSVLVILPARADRYDRQEARIRHGVESGSLTRGEFRHLRRERHRTRQMARDFRMDGHLSYEERQILAHRNHRLSRDIWRLKHNRRDRYHHRRYYD